MVIERSRKPRKPSGPYARKPGPKPKAKDAPKTSAITQPKHARQNLTLFDWLTVIEFQEQHPMMSQAQIVAHFSSLKDGKLVFDQSTLSRKFKMKDELKARAQSFPNALSSKRPRIVTCPTVDRALALWVAHMEDDRNESVTSAMLIAKRARFEEQFGIPEEERLADAGWVPSFLRAYEHCIHYLFSN